MGSSEATVRKALLFGFATAGMALVGLFAPWSVAHSGPTLAYFGAPSFVEAEVNSKQGESADCAWVEGPFQTAAGTSASVRATKNPLWVIDFGEIRNVIIYERNSFPTTARSHPTAVAYVEIKKEAQNRIDALRKNPCAGFVRVVRDGSASPPFSLEGMAPWFLPGGEFGSREEAERFYADIEKRVSFVALSEEAQAYERRLTQAANEGILWEAKCNPDWVKSFGDDAYEDVMTKIMQSPSLQEQMEKVNCEARLPELSTGAFSYEFLSSDGVPVDLSALGERKVTASEIRAALARELAPGSTAEAIEQFFDKNQIQYSYHRLMGKYQGLIRGISASSSLYQLVEIWISVDERQRCLRADVREFSIAR